MRVLELRQVLLPPSSVSRLRLCISSSVDGWMQSERAGSTGGGWRICVHMHVELGQPHGCERTCNDAIAIYVPSLKGAGEDLRVLRKAIDSSRVTDCHSKAW